MKHIYINISQFDIANQITNLFNEMQAFFLVFIVYRWSTIVLL